MTRRVLFAITILPAALLLFCNPARGQENPTTSPSRREEMLPPYADKFPRPGYDIPPHLRRGDDDGPGPPRQSLTKEEKRLLAVPREDHAAYTGLLRGSRGGLIRLLPREDFDGKLRLRGGGAYYSFTRREHQYGYGSDLEFQGGHFSVGFAGADFGFLADLGDTPLEVVSEHTDAVRLLAEFEPPSAEREARAIQLRLLRGGGHRMGPSIYGRRRPAIVGHTYVLRSINYDRSDVLVAFRVLREDDNGSVVLLWKTLRAYPRPMLRRDQARR